MAESGYSGLAAVASLSLEDGVDDIDHGYVVARIDECQQKIDAYRKRVDGSEGRTWAAAFAQLDQFQAYLDERRQRLDTWKTHHDAARDAMRSARAAFAELPTDSELVTPAEYREFHNMPDAIPSLTATRSAERDQAANKILAKMNGAVNDHAANIDQRVEDTPKTPAAPPSPAVPPSGPGPMPRPRMPKIVGPVPLPRPVYPPIPPGPWPPTPPGPHPPGPGPYPPAPGPWPPTPPHPDGPTIIDPPHPPAPPVPEPVPTQVSIGLGGVIGGGVAAKMLVPSWNPSAGSGSAAGLASGVQSFGGGRAASAPAGGMLRPGGTSQGGAGAAATGRSGTTGAGRGATTGAGKTARGAAAGAGRGGTTGAGKSATARGGTAGTGRGGAAGTGNNAAAKAAHGAKKKRRQVTLRGYQVDRVEDDLCGEGVISEAASAGSAADLKPLTTHDDTDTW